MNYRHDLKLFDHVRCDGLHSFRNEWLCLWNLFIYKQAHVIV